MKGAGLAAHPGKAMGQHAAGQEFTKLPHDELEQAGAGGLVRCGVEKVIQVLADDHVQACSPRNGGVDGSGWQCPRACVAPPVKRANAQKVMQPEAVPATSQAVDAAAVPGASARSTRTAMRRLSVPPPRRNPLTGGTSS